MSLISESAPAVPVAVAPWAYQVLEAVDSTNTYAGKLPAWTAVRAKTQQAGRGRTRDRQWVSDLGGLWLSAVVPCPGPRSRWEVLPLLAGQAVVLAADKLGVSGARLRWPNDVMVGHGKLAGILVERYTDETAVVGIGLNVFNQPELVSPVLVGQTARLSTLACTEFELDEVANRVLRALHQIHQRFVADGFGPIATELNRAWTEPRRVEVTLNGAAPRAGWFHGVDERGRLRVAFSGTTVEIFDATEIALLRESD